MKTQPLLLPAALCAALSLAAQPPSSSAQSPAPDSPVAPAPVTGAGSLPVTPPRADTAQLLREALFEEQGIRDLDKAAAAYDKVIAAYDAERSFAATALYRLAEVRRAQNKKDQAAALYQRLLAEFPNHDPLARLSRENLAALGVKDVPGGAPAAGPVDEQAARIAELKQMLKDSPDNVTVSSDTNDPLPMAARDGQAKVVQFLLEAGAKASDSILRDAVSSGHLSVCEALIAHGADVNSSGALSAAVDAGHMEVFRLLLDKGADVNRRFVLGEAVSMERPEMVRLLLEKGADPNFVDKETGNNALFYAGAATNKELLDLLIAAKARPNLPPPAKSALYRAVQHGNLEMAKRLIGLGADIHVRCADSRENFRRRGHDNPFTPVSGRKPSLPDYSSTLDPEGCTLLHAAIVSKKPEMLDLVLSSGGASDIDIPGGSGQFTPLAVAISYGPATVIEALLKAGANPNVQALANPGDSISPMYPALFLAGTRPEGENLVKLMLAAGADAKVKAADGSTAPGYLVKLGEKGLPIYRQLITAGADPGVFFDNLKGSVPVMLSREFRYPSLASEGKVTLSFPEDGFLKTLASSADQAGLTPAGLPDLLLEAGELRWLDELPPDWGTLRLFRRDPQGVLKEEVVKDWMAGAAPVLQWGDIVEFVSANWQRPDTRTHQNFSYESGLPQEVRNRLQAALLRHVTVTMDGKTWPVTLRGALKVYNPLKPEAPLMDAVSLMKMMGAEDLRWFYAGVKVKRQADQGGGEITAILRRGANIPLKEGDALELVGEPAEIRLQAGGSGAVVQSPDTGGGLAGLGEIVLLSPGLPFSKSMTVTGDSGSPGLVQFLAATWQVAGTEALNKMIAADKVAKVTGLSGKSAVEAMADESPQLLPHPDWAQLKIRRPGENGEFTEIPVNLAAAIAACTEATTPGEARKADVLLKSGDTVLLPVLQDQREQTWTGWDPATVRFFSKALSMQVTLADADGSFRALNLEYLPLRYVETPAGLLGLPAQEPAQNRLNAFSAGALISKAAPGKRFAWLQRAGSAERAGDTSWALMPGDTIGLEAINAPQVNNLPPRVRRVIPPVR